MYRDCIGMIQLCVDKINYLHCFFFILDKFLQILIIYICKKKTAQKHVKVQQHYLHILELASSISPFILRTKQAMIFLFKKTFIVIKYYCFIHPGAFFSLSLFVIPGRFLFSRAFSGATGRFLVGPVRAFRINNKYDHHDCTI